MIAETDLVKTQVDTLSTVIDILKDGEQGFDLIGQDLKDENLKASFLAESQRRAAFRQTLEEALHQIGVAETTESGTVIGAIHRSWGDIKAKLGGSDHTLLDTAVQGEEAVVQAYRMA